MSRTVMTLWVDAAGLAKVVLDLAPTIDLMDFVNDRGVGLSVRPARDKHGNDDPENFLVFLDKHQCRYLRSRMTVEAFADRYGAARDAGSR